MSSLKYLLVILIIAMVSACAESKQDQSAKVLADTPENRTVVAKRYLEAMPPKDLMQAVATRVAPTLPEKDRKPFLEVMASPGMDQTAHRIMLEALVKNFTVGELNAMVAFYGSPEGQASIKKFGPLMTEVMPQIQQEVKKALAAISPPQEPKEPTKPSPPTKSKEAPKPKAP